MGGAALAASGSGSSGPYADARDASNG